jgi:hypothetical protein
MKRKLSRDEVIAALTYDPLTGVFTWARNAGGGMKAGDVAGNVGENGYIAIGLYGEIYRAHRLAWLWMTGDWPEHDIDHINGIRRDNRWENLRYADKLINAQNIKGPRADNTSGFLGVHFDKRHKQWKAQININKKRAHIGRFDTPEEAHQAYLEAKRKHHVGCTI